MAQRSMRRIQRWRAPPNWSPRDWFEEMKAETIAAAREAERDFDPTRGVPLLTFVHLRVFARAQRRYRREWAYARRCRPHNEGEDSKCLPDDASSFIDVTESLRRHLDRLPELQRQLIENLY
jgi:hypothetical protein